MNRLLAIACLCLAACGTPPPVAEPAFAGHMHNACVPEAAAMCEGLHGAGITARVLIITTPTWRHAVCVYLYPSGENRLWVWDSTWKSINVRAFIDDPDQVARSWMVATRRTIPVTSAEYL